MRVLRSLLVSGLVLAGAVAAAPAEAAWPDLSAPAKGRADASKDAAVIVAIEDYLLVSDVPGARENATDWYTFLTDTRGVPAENVHLLKDTGATREAILDHTERAAKQVQEGGTLWFVFIGHGAAAADGSDGVLVGADAQQTAQGLYARAVKQKEIVARLEASKAAQRVAVIDACFSGRSADGSAIAAGLQPLVVQRGEVPVGSGTAVLTAGAGDQFAGPLPSLARPAFSYLTLGALRGWADSDGDGAVTVLEASRYAQKALTVLPLGREQTPALIGARDLVLSRGVEEKGPDLRRVTKGDGPASTSGGAPPAPGAPARPGDVAPPRGARWGRPSDPMPADANLVAFRTDEDGEWAVRSRTGDLVCVLPCDRWLMPMADLRLVHESGEAYDVPANLGTPGKALVAEVETGSPGVSTFGSILFWGLGLPGLVVGIGSGIAAGGGAETGAIMAAGFGVGTAGTLGGIALWVGADGGLDVDDAPTARGASLHLGLGTLHGTF